MWNAVIAAMVMFGVVSIASVICLTVRSHYKRIDDGRLAVERAKGAREYQRLEILKSMWDERVQMEREGISPPKMDSSWEAAMRKFVD